MIKSIGKNLIVFQLDQLDFNIHSLIFKLIEIMNYKGVPDENFSNTNSYCWIYSNDDYSIIKAYGNALFIETSNDLAFEIAWNLHLLNDKPMILTCDNYSFHLLMNNYKTLDELKARIQQPRPYECVSEENIPQD